MQADIGKQINVRFEYKQVVGIWILRNIMKAVGRMASLHIDAKMLPVVVLFLWT